MIFNVKLITCVFGRWTAAKIPKITPQKDKPAKDLIFSLGYRDQALASNSVVGSNVWSKKIKKYVIK